MYILRCVPILVLDKFILYTYFILKKIISIPKFFENKCAYKFVI